MMATEALLTWDDLCADPRFNDFPYKVELNKQGKIIMSPARNRHSYFQGTIAATLGRIMPSGKVMVECGVRTSDNVKVADVAWCSTELFKKIAEETFCSIAPEICVEVWSMTNTDEEMNWKRDLYFESGAREFWFCDQEGTLFFHDHAGPMNASKLCPDFPKSVK